MKEAKDIMDIDWATHIEDSFEGLSPMTAIDRFVRLANEGGENAVNGDPKRLPLVTAMAHLKEKDIIDWVNKMVPDHNIELFNLYQNKISYYRDICRTAIRLPPIEIKIN